MSTDIDIQNAGNALHPPSGTPPGASYPPIAPNGMPYGMSPPYGISPNAFHNGMPHGPQGMPPSGLHQRQMQPMQMPPLPHDVDPEPPRVKFKGRNYLITADIFKQKRPIPPSSGRAFAELIIMTLRYGIPALEAEHDIKVSTLEGIRLNQEVEQDEESTGKGKLFIEIRIKGKVYKTEITDTYKLSTDAPSESESTPAPLSDQQKVCQILEGTTTDCCHSHHDTAKKTFIEAVRILRTNRGFSKGAVPAYTSVLELIAYDQLPEAFKEKHPKKEQPVDSSSDTHNPSSTPETQKSEENNKTPEDSDSAHTKPKQDETYGGLKPYSIDSYSDAELVLGNIPNLNDQDSTHTRAEPRWKKYLLEGKLITSENSSENEVQSVNPVTFKPEEAAKIFIKIRHCRERRYRRLTAPFATLGFDEFNDKEQVFIKRLLLILVKTKNMAEEEGRNGRIEETTNNIAVTLGSAIINDHELAKILDSEYNPATFNETNPACVELNQYLLTHIQQTNYILQEAKKRRKEASSTTV